MRKTIRVIVAVLLAFMIQSTVLPHLRVGGVIFDLLTIVLCTIGYTCGFYTGLTAGLFAALMMETVGGDLPGLASLICVAPGGLGAWVALRVRRFSLPGRRPLERRVKRLAPMVLAMLIEVGKETLYLAYFYLTGMSITWAHAGRILLAGAWVGTFSLVLMPLIAGFVRRSPEESFLGRRARRRKVRREARSALGDEKDDKREKRPRTPEEAPPAQKKQRERRKGGGPSLGELVRMSPTEGGDDS